MIRALIADDHLMMREGLKFYLVCNLDIHVDEVENGLLALEYVRNNTPDIVILDISMPGMDGLQTLRAIKDIKPEIPVLMLSAYSEEQFAEPVMVAGASGYLMKTAAADELVNAVEQILKGEQYLSSEVRNIFLKHQAGSEASSAPDDQFANGNRSTESTVIPPNVIQPEIENDEAGGW